MKLMEATEQIKVLNEQLEVQKVAVTKKSEACNILLKDISEKQGLGEEKRTMAQVYMCTLYAGEHCHRVALIPSTIVLCH